MPKITRPTTEGIMHKDSTLYDYLNTNVYRVIESTSELSTIEPLYDGEVVRVKYAAKPAVAGVDCGIVGGGEFVAYNDKQNYHKDGGVYIDSPHATLKWKRINFTQYDPCFWGVIPDHVTDNADAIQRAHLFAKANKVNLYYPKGVILTSKPVPIYDSMGIFGQGRQEGTAIQKTTNDTYSYIGKLGTVVETVNALVVCIPEAYDRADHSMASFCNHWTISGIIFRRNGLSEATYDIDKPQYGLFAPKCASFLLERTNFEGGYFGIKGYVHFSACIRNVGVTNWRGKGYAGYHLEDYRDGSLMSSGTSMIYDTLQVRGYCFGQTLSRLQYSELRCCTYEEISPCAGEQHSYALDIKDPFSIVVNACATEFVKGGQIRLGAFANPSFKPSISINNWFAVDQQNPDTPHRIISIDNGGVTRYTVDIVGGDWTLDVRCPNIQKACVSGNESCIVFTRATTGLTKNDWEVQSSAKVFDPENP